MIDKISQQHPSGPVIICLLVWLAGSIIGIVNPGFFMKGRGAELEWKAMGLHPDKLPKKFRIFCQIVWSLVFLTGLVITYFVLTGRILIII